MAITSRERHIRVPRTARYRVLGEPGEAEEVWFVLHGYRQLAERFVRRFEELPGLGSRRAVVAPEALSRFYVEREVGPHGPGSRVGASWMTREDREHEIRDYVEYLDRVAEAVAAPGSLPRIVMLGFSQGSETASRWAVRGRTRPSELILWGGGLAVDLEEAPMREVLTRCRVVHVVGDEDEWGARRAAQSERRLAGLGLESHRVSYGGGHRVTAPVLRANWSI